MWDFFSPKRKGGKASLLPREGVEVFKVLGAAWSSGRFLAQRSWKWMIFRIPSNPAQCVKSGAATPCSEVADRVRARPLKPDAIQSTQLCRSSICPATEASPGRISTSSSQKLFTCWELLVSCQCQGMRSLLLTQARAPLCTRALPEEQEADPERILLCHAGRAGPARAVG